ncbi:MAG: thiamine pyrophosphate-dependent enzyme [Bacteroidota bacterium]
MDSLLLLGDEAIGQGALDAGISGVYAYPGTPSTEITEYIQASREARQRNVHRVWSANEKTAMEEALGMSYAGKRALVYMKHVGLNVAADAFINAAITGINGGMVVVVADDPSMHSSQNEQDSRYYAKFAMIPVLEPATQQEAYEATIKAFDLSEEFGLPVMLRITTRLAHSRSVIRRARSRKENVMMLPSDLKQFILLPAIARGRYQELLAKQEKLVESAEKSSYNVIQRGENKQTGIIAAGIGFNYVMENYNNGLLPFSILKISHYPLPVNTIREFIGQHENILVVEEGYPFIEESLIGILGKVDNINGKLNGVLPRTGELNPGIVGKALGIEIPSAFEVPELLVNRPPALCRGCGHADLYLALNEAMIEHGKGKVFSDIGCYTLGALPPFNSINTCVDMGASITMAKGAADAGMLPSVCVIGDSTFTHSGMTGLLDAVNEKTPVTIIISDNSTTGMTGGQKSSATGRLQQICLGLGVEPEHLKMLVPLKKNHEKNVDALKAELAYNGVSVIIAQRECIQTAARRVRASKTVS